jgi:protein-S-isoprenylcysteine O-methyltransferase Ste14
VFAQYLTLVLAWGVFGLLHSVLATSVVKQRAKILLKNSFRYYRLLYSLIAVASLAWVLHTHFSIQQPILWLPSWIQKFIAKIMGVTGLLIMVRCIRKYFSYLSGIDVFFERPQQATLEQGGMHAVVRHPLYAGTLLFVWGVFVASPYMNHLVTCVCITVYTLIGMHFEERKLVKEYGEAYRIYQKKVPALIPRL